MAKKNLFRITNENPKTNETPRDGFKIVEVEFSDQEGNTIKKLTCLSNKLIKKILKNK